MIKKAASMRLLLILQHAKLKANSITFSIITKITHLFLTNYTPSITFVSCVAVKRPHKTTCFAVKSRGYRQDPAPAEREC